VACVIWAIEWLGLPGRDWYLQLSIANCLRSASFGKANGLHEGRQGGQNVIFLRKIVSQQQTVTSAVRDFAGETCKESGLRFDMGGLNCGCEVWVGGH